MKLTIDEFRILLSKYADEQFEMGKADINADPDAYTAMLNEGIRLRNRMIDEVIRLHYVAGEPV